MVRYNMGTWGYLVLALLAAGCGRSHFSDGPDSGLLGDGGPGSIDSGSPQVDGGSPSLDAGLVRSDSGLPDAGQRTDAGQVHRLTMLTINLWHDFPSFSNLDARTQMVADFIKARKPDMVAAQEVGESGIIKNRCKVIGEKAGYEYRWVSEGGLSVVFSEGPCVLSRWPIVDSKSVSLPHPQQSGLVLRQAIAARVQWRHGLLTMVSTHFSNGADAANDRTDQAVKAYGLVREYAGALPVFMGGDFNSTPDTAAMKFLRGEQAVGNVSGAMLDSWHEARPQEPGETASEGRIDYLYVDLPVKGAVHVADCEIVLNQPTNGIYPSDHFGVLCEYDLTLGNN